MPWKKFSVGKGQYKVWKIDEQGEKVGEPLSSKPQSAEQADSQVRALYASEKPKKEADTYTISEGETITATVTGDPNGVTTTEVKGMMMDDEMPMKPMKDDMGGMMMGPCSWEEMEAMEQAEETTGELYEMNDKMGMMARNVMQSPMIEDKAAALADLAKGYAERMTKMMAHPAEKSVEDIAKQIAGDNQPGEDDDRPDELKAVWTGKYIGSLPDSSFLYVEEGCKVKGCRHFPVKDAQGKLDLPHLRNAIARIPQSNAPGLSPEKKTQLQKRAQAMLENANKKDLFIWKEGDTYRWIAAYSNNRRDNDSPPEIISTESHKEFDAALQKGEWPLPEVWLWHVPYPVGVADYHAFDESTGFPVAAGHFYKGMEWAAEGVMQANWDGVSHGMPSEWIERDKDDSSIIIRHRTKEITFLPLWAAANKLAFSIINKEQIMADEKGLPAHKREEFVKAFGEERVEQIEMTLADKAKEADEAGIEKKALRQAHPRELPGAGDEQVETPTETLTPESPVVKALEMVVTRLDAFDTRLKTIEALRQAQDEQTEAVEVKEEPFDLMEFLKGKSAIGQLTTKVDGRSKEAKDAPEEAKQESWTERASGIRVSLVDELVGANQAYYQEHPTNGR